MHKSKSVCFSAIGLYLLFGLITVAHAEGFLTQYINQIASAQTVKAYLSTKPHTGIDCSFTAKSIPNIEQIKKILHRADLNEVPILEAHLPVIGLRLEFTLLNGNVVEMAFGKEYYGEKLVDGMVRDTSKKDPVYFLAERFIYKDIYNWVRQKEINARAFFYTGQYPLFCEKWKEEMKFDEGSFRSCLSSRERETFQQTQQCEAIRLKTYYQTSEKQTCDFPFIHRSVSDLCPSGWK